MSEIAKREKARRVWRLNKKEGIPVLEALETVEISKDVYYRIKDNYEEEWEEEILTVEQIQKELSEAGERHEKLENKIEQLEERFQRMKSEFVELDVEKDRLKSARKVDRKMKRFESTLEDVSAALDVEYGNATNRLERVERKVEKFDELDLVQKVEDLDREVGNTRKVAESAEKEAKKAREEQVESIWDLL